MRVLDNDNRIIARVCSQVSLTVTGDSVFRTLQERVMKWAFDPNRNLRGIPDAAWRGESFEIDADNSERAAAVRLEDPKYWAFRFAERLKDANRIWTTEVGLAEISPEEAVFGCRVICSQRGDAEPIPRSIPRFVRSIAFVENAFLDGRSTSPDPWFVNDALQLEAFLELLFDPTRRHPVVVFSLPEGSNDPTQTAIPVLGFLRRTIGFVHTVVLGSDAAFELTEDVGQEFSVFQQAIRTYNPGFDPDRDLWTDHPVAMAHTIRDWSDEDDDGKAFTDFLVHQALRPTRPRDELEHEQPPFHKIKQLSAQLAREQARQAGDDDSELLVLAEEELVAAKRQTEDSLDLAVAAEAEKDEALDEVRQIKASYIALQQRLASLQSGVQAGNTQEDERPESLKDIGDWARRHLSGDVELLDRAVKAATRSDFQDVGLVYDALLMMRDCYVPMRRKGGKDKLDAYRVRLAELGLEDTKCFKQDNKAKNFGGDYFVRYQGDRRELDWHLKGRSSRDERYGFRLYYFWDAETSRVVVGYLPGHLKNDVT